MIKLDFVMKKNAIRSMFISLHKTQLETDLISQQKSDSYTKPDTRESGELS